MHMYLYVYVYMHMYMCWYMYMYLYTCGYIYMYVYGYIYIYIHMQKPKLSRICCLNIDTCTYTCLYTYTHIDCYFYLSSAAAQHAGFRVFTHILQRSTWIRVLGFRVSRRHTRSSNMALDECSRPSGPNTTVSIVVLFLFSDSPVWYFEDPNHKNLLTTPFKQKKTQASPGTQVAPPSGAMHHADDCGTRGLHHIRPCIPQLSVVGDARRGGGCNTGEQTLTSRGPVNHGLNGKPQIYIPWGSMYPTNVPL